MRATGDPKGVDTDAARRDVALHWGLRASWALCLFAAVAAAVGLFAPGVYRETAWALPQVRGQEAVTLVAVAVLCVCLTMHRRGSVNALLVAIGLAGYVWYTYVGATFSYRFNALFLVYVACFSTSTAALIALFLAVDPAAVSARFAGPAPRFVTAGYLALVGVALSALWLPQIVAFPVTGTLPDLLTKANAVSSFVFALDLGVVVPLCLLAVVLLLRGEAWGTVLAVPLLIKVVTMGAALLSMGYISEAARLPVDPFLSRVWLGMTLSASAVLAWLLVSGLRATAR